MNLIALIIAFLLGSGAIVGIGVSSNKWEKSKSEKSYKLEKEK